MIKDEILQLIAEKYYDEIYNFCYSKLKNQHSAEDCTQEVFYTLVKKRNRLYFSFKIRSWLYKTAEKTIKNYVKNNKQSVPLDEIQDTIPDEHNLFDSDIDKIYEYLDREEADLLIEYIECDYGKRDELAEKYGMSKSAFYSKVNRIRKKLIDNWKK